MTLEALGILAKAQFEALDKWKVEYTTADLGIILDLVGMTDSDISGAIHTAKVIQVKRGIRKTDTVYSSMDILKLYFASILVKEERERIASKEDNKERFMWGRVRTDKIPAMVRNKREDLFYGDEKGQKVIDKMYEIYKAHRL